MSLARTCARACYIWPKKEDTVCVFFGGGGWGKDSAHGSIKFNTTNAIGFISQTLFREKIFLWWHIGANNRKISVHLLNYIFQFSILGFNLSLSKLFPDWLRLFNTSLTICYILCKYQDTKLVYESATWSPIMCLLIQNHQTLTTLSSIRGLPFKKIIRDCAWSGINSNYNN